MQALTLYHGGSTSSFCGIVNDELKSSLTGRLGGKCKYFTTDLETAKKIAALRMIQRNDVGYMVLEYRINVPASKIKDLNSESDLSGSWQNQNYDIATSIHPDWSLELQINSFREYAVKDSFPLPQSAHCYIKGTIKITQDTVFHGGLTLL